MAPKGGDRLSFDKQAELAERLGYTSHGGLKHVERFMKHYFLIAKDVGDLTRIFCAVLEAREMKKAPTLSRILRGLKDGLKDGLAGGLTSGLGRTIRNTRSSASTPAASTSSTTVSSATIRSTSSGCSAWRRSTTRPFTPMRCARCAAR
jgi:hypothetical protein